MWAAIYFVAIVALAVAMYQMAPKPQNAKPAGLNEFNVPTAEVGRDIPVLFGERDLEAPNVVWYGDLSSQAIRKKV